MEHPDRPHPKNRNSLTLGHQLLELADRYHVGVHPGLRRDILTLQDRIVANMDAHLARDLGEDKPDSPGGQVGGPSYMGRQK